MYSLPANSRCMPATSTGKTLPSLAHCRISKVMLPCCLSFAHSTGLDSLCTFGDKSYTVIDSSSWCEYP